MGIFTEEYSMYVKLHLLKFTVKRENAQNGEYPLPLEFNGLGLSFEGRVANSAGPGRPLMMITDGRLISPLDFYKIFKSPIVLSNTLPSHFINCCFEDIYRVVFLFQNLHVLYP